MTPADRGRFCASCQKQVLDFTNSSDNEIISIIKSDANICAKIRPSQMDRPLQDSKSVGNIKVPFAVAASLVLLAGTAEVKAQNTPQIVQHTPENFPLGKIAYTEPTTIVSGKVKDEQGNPIPDVYIIITGTSTSTVTDANGTFSIEAKYAQQLEFSGLGYSKYVYEIPAESKPFNVTLKEEVLVGVMVVVARKTFFGRIFQSIGNIFR